MRHLKKTQAVIYTNFQRTFFRRHIFVGDNSSLTRLSCENSQKIVSSIIFPNGVIDYDS
jgi:hypothetical protein